MYKLAAIRHMYGLTRTYASNASIGLLKRLLMPKHHETESVWELYKVNSIMDLKPYMIKNFSHDKLNELSSYIAEVSYVEYNGHTYIINTLNMDAGRLHITPMLLTTLLIELMRKDFTVDMALKHTYRLYGGRDVFLYPVNP